MTSGRILELAAAGAILVAGLMLYRRRAKTDGNYGSQGAVILFVIAVIMAIHALGGLDYRPTESELEMMRGGGQ